MVQEQIRLHLQPGETTVGQVLDRIRRESRDEHEKGRWFEELVARVLRENPEYEVAQVHRWRDWPERFDLTGKDARDLGIDLVAQHVDGAWTAIQCKCYRDGASVGKREIDSFLGNSGREPFSQRWIIATCGWTVAAEEEIDGLTPPARQIDFRRHVDDPISDEVAKPPVRNPLHLQKKAIENVVRGLRNSVSGRGRLIMPCGTGKTFTSLRIAERVVPDGGRILFVAPSIGLVSQARREWLRHTTRPLTCRVVCSDRTAGGRGESEDIRVYELECPVTSAPADIAAVLGEEPDLTRVVFSTYQSLEHVTAAQFAHGAPTFDLAIMDEAHRTTGVDRRASGIDRDSGFQAVHDEERLRTRKRLYMTATPRIYRDVARAKLKARGIETVDMGDNDVYGPELHSLTFKEAVNAGMLSDYRVIVLGVHENAVTPGIRRSLVALSESQGGSGGQTMVLSEEDMTRVMGTSFAINGIVEGPAIDKPGPSLRTIAFANSRWRSKFFAEALKHPLVRRMTTRRLRGHDPDAGAARPLESQHLDARNSALERNQALRRLKTATSDRVLQLLSNVRLFGEGVDVPALDAIVFMEPRDSQVDVVQAVGRVMRRSKETGKRFGYIVVPVPIEPGGDIAGALSQGSTGYQAVGKVLRALQAHDGRLAEEPLRFVQTYRTRINGGGNAGGADAEQVVLDLEDVSPGLFAQVVAASGLGKPGLRTSQDIESVVKAAGRALDDADLADDLAVALGLALSQERGRIPVIAALLLANACLLHKRLSDLPGMETLPKLNGIGGTSDPAGVLQDAWREILDRDYAPVFEPALAVLDALDAHNGAGALPQRQVVTNALLSLVECANRVADSLSELGYDHAGPLYHRILPSAKSEGAFYTKNLSALMLARLALNEDFVDWNDPEAVANLRVIDPACGTGTLLMAALHVIKARSAEARGLDDEGVATLHRQLVEDALCGLDINRHAVQLAACNLTLGAPTVDYRRMNLATLRNGPQPDGDVRSGSLEILVAAGSPDSLQALRRPLRSLSGVGAEQVDRAADLRFPLSGNDLVLMNPPFTNNVKRHRQFDPDTVKRMQRHEMGIRDEVEARDGAAGSVIDANSLRTFFTPLMDRLLDNERSTLGNVLPTTACTSASGLPERRFLASRFHVETIITSHDPQALSFSENTSINECLLIARRRTRDVVEREREREREREQDRSQPGSSRSAECRPLPTRRSPLQTPSPRALLWNGAEASAGQASESKQATGRRASGTTRSLLNSPATLGDPTDLNPSDCDTGSGRRNKESKTPSSRVKRARPARSECSGRWPASSAEPSRAKRMSGAPPSQARRRWQNGTGTREAISSWPRGTGRPPVA